MSRKFSASRAACLDRTRIENSVIRLEEWETDGGVRPRRDSSDRTTSVLGVRVPEIVMPVRLSGRNLAVLVEVATLNERLKVSRGSSRRRRVQ